VPSVSRAATLLGLLGVSFGDWFASWSMGGLTRAIGFGSSIMRKPHVLLHLSMIGYMTGLTHCFGKW
jgi:hypothetical protein